MIFYQQVDTDLYTAYYANSFLLPLTEAGERQWLLQATPYNANATARIWRGTDVLLDIPPQSSGGARSAPHPLNLPLKQGERYYIGAHPNANNPPNMILIFRRLPLEAEE